MRRTLLAGESLGPMELRRSRKDGTWMDVSLSAAPLHDSKGEVVGMLGVMLDITNQKRVRREQRLLGETVAASLNEIYLFDAETLRFRYVNQGALHNMGYTLAEMQRMTPLDIAPEFDRERFEKLIQPLLRGESRVQVFETTHRRADGSLYPVEVHLQLFDHDGERVFLAMILDITERRRAAEALRRSEEQLLQSQKMEGIGLLAGGVAHDFNNHLTVINGYCDMLLGKLPAGHDRCANRLGRSGRPASRPPASPSNSWRSAADRCSNRRFSTSTRLSPTRKNMLRRLIGEDIELITMLDPALGAIMADPGQMKQVLMNLLINARDAMPEGGKITIETANVDLDEAYAARHPEVNPGPYVMLAVSDTGTGIEPGTLEHIFEPFFTTKRPGKGTGLGLATVYGIVRQSGGWIWVYSEPGRGTTFKIYIPRTGVAPRTVAEARAGIRAWHGNGAGGRGSGRGT